MAPGGFSRRYKCRQFARADLRVSINGSKLAQPFKMSGSTENALAHQTFSSCEVLRNDIAVNFCLVYPRSLCLLLKLQLLLLGVELQHLVAQGC